MLRGLKFVTLLSYFVEALTCIREGKMFSLALLLIKFVWPLMSRCRIVAIVVETTKLAVPYPFTPLSSPLISSRKHQDLLIYKTSLVKDI